MSSFWHKVMSAIDQKNVIIRGKGFSLNIETQLIKDLLDEMQNLRDSWEIILQESQVVAEAVGISSHFITRRRPSRLPNADENTIEGKLQLEATNEFKSFVIFPVLDFIMENLKTRLASSELICYLFSPILTMDLDSDQLKIASMAPCFIQKRTLLSFSTPFMRENLKLFFNSCTGIKLFCTIPVTVSTTERCYSRMANSLKTWQRITTGQNRLNHLAILGMENELAKSVYFSGVIGHFSHKKARKVYNLV
ncbi:hypothetical protein PR048_006555 [Dryococelus australis]|uniref:HAT C-terminal dimerisation domain-containing protein n=1 Tax=Dryococelus australis TaxID=614101 RepID=A0ABQ9IBA5_9NEOP|nr:hypothetical protein PR048_006555 [Dryococelus australis]